MAFVLALSCAIYSTLDVLGKLNQSHFVRVPNSNGNKVSSSLNIYKNSNTEFLRSMKSSESESSNVSSLFVKTPGDWVSHDVSNRDLDFCLSFILVFNEVHEIIHFEVLAHVRGRIQAF